MRIAHNPARHANTYKASQDNWNEQTAKVDLQEKIIRAAAIQQK
ncbi:hypothetical protein P608_09495 [Comamonas thiooxydans]|uniref:Uncharacterized protein n=2 Tax=Comamonas TaxID=283 RepID=A0A0E3BVE2_9BURK|nr:hypothetical protein O987_22060 [Comamonas testosteroni TK102]KGG91604.1 hypothetical protein P245_13455 [Comamonas thiooxydans]KGH12863.1 hypothetical protein P608_09495 [Comamonas thiooxydans]KGH23964.1 hypothetical protein P606_09710 [Comamonas thiooxydans]KGH25592.1 hypothetical protein P607_05085 [Comamonas thiooxydans]